MRTDADIEQQCAKVDQPEHARSRNSESTETNSVENVITKYQALGKPPKEEQDASTALPASLAAETYRLCDLGLCLWVLSLTYSSTAYVSSAPAIYQEFGGSREVISLGVSLMVIGFAGGPLVAGPLSEVLGRRPVYAFCGLLYSAFSWGAAFAPNLATLLVCRFLMGVFGSASINNVPASIGDFTTPAQRGPFTIVYAICAFGGPTLGPLCGSFIQRDAGMRWNLRVIAIYISLTSIGAALVPETHGTTIVKRELKRAVRSPPELSKNELTSLLRVALSRPFIYLFTEPICTVVCLYLAILYGTMYGFFSAFSIVFVEIRGMTPVSYGLTYIGLGIGFLIGAVLLATVANQAYVKSAARAQADGVSTPPEARLTLSYSAALLSPISLFIFAWTAPFTSVHWIVPVFAELLFGCSMLCLFTSFIPYIIECYLPTAASALAAGMASRALIGGVFPLFTVQMFEGLTVQGATSLLAGVLCLLAPVPFVFRSYGLKLRSMSKHAVSQE